MKTSIFWLICKRLRHNFHSLLYSEVRCQAITYYIRYYSVHFCLKYCLFIAELLTVVNLSDLLDPNHSARGFILRNFKVIPLFLMMRVLNDTCQEIQLFFKNIFLWF